MEGHSWDATHAQRFHDVPALRYRRQEDVVDTSKTSRVPLSPMLTATGSIRPTAVPHSSNMSARQAADAAVPARAPVSAPSAAPRSSSVSARQAADTTTPAPGASIPALARQSISKSQPQQPPHLPPALRTNSASVPGGPEPGPTSPINSVDTFSFAVPASPSMDRSVSMACTSTADSNSNASQSSRQSLGHSDSAGEKAHSQGSSDLAEPPLPSRQSASQVDTAGYDRATRSTSNAADRGASIGAGLPAPASALPTPLSPPPSPEQQPAAPATSSSAPPAPPSASSSAPSFHQGGLAGLLPGVPNPPAAEGLLRRPSFHAVKAPAGAVSSRTSLPSSPQSSRPGSPSLSRTHSKSALDSKILEAAMTPGAGPPDQLPHPPHPHLEKVYQLAIGTAPSGGVGVPAAAVAGAEAIPPARQGSQQAYDAPVPAPEANTSASAMVAALARNTSVSVSGAAPVPAPTSEPASTQVATMATSASTPTPAHLPVTTSSALPSAAPHTSAAPNMPSQAPSTPLAAATLNSAAQELTLAPPPSSSAAQPSQPAPSALLPAGASASTSDRPPSPATSVPKPAALAPPATTAIQVPPWSPALAPGPPLTQQHVCSDMLHTVN